MIHPSWAGGRAVQLAHPRVKCGGVLRGGYGNGRRHLRSDEKAISWHRFASPLLMGHGTAAILQNRKVECAYPSHDAAKAYHGTVTLTSRRERGAPLAGRIADPSEAASKEHFLALAFAPRLNEDIEHNTMLSDGALEVMLYPLSPDGDFVPVPLIPRPAGGSASKLNPLHVWLADCLLRFDAGEGGARTDRHRRQALYNHPFLTLGQRHDVVVVSE